MLIDNRPLQRHESTRRIAFGRSFPDDLEPRRERIPRTDRIGEQYLIEADAPQNAALSVEMVDDLSLRERERLQPTGDNLVKRWLRCDFITGMKREWVVSPTEFDDFLLADLSVIEFICFSSDKIAIIEDTYIISFYSIINSNK